MYVSIIPIPMCEKALKANWISVCKDVAITDKPVAMLRYFFLSIRNYSIINVSTRRLKDLLQGSRVINLPEFHVHNIEYEKSNSHADSDEGERRVEVKDRGQHLHDLQDDARVVCVGRRLPVCKNSICKFNLNKFLTRLFVL